MAFLAKDDYRELHRYGERQLDKICDRAKDKGISLGGFYHLGWILVKPTDPTSFKLHYLAFAKNGHLWLLNHTKEDIACQITEWYMSDCSWEYPCPCVKLLLALRYGQQGLWPVSIEVMPRLMDHKTKHIFKGLQQRGLERLGHKPAYIQWKKENPFYAGSSPVAWLAKCQPKIFHAFRAIAPAIWRWDVGS